MAAVDHDPRDAVNCVVLLFAEGTAVLIQKPTRELVDLFAIQIWGVLCLFEEEGSWVLEFLSH